MKFLPLGTVLESEKINIPCRTNVLSIPEPKDFNILLLL